MGLYNKSFYRNRDKRTKHAARTILPLIFSNYRIKSVADFGCGVGTWLGVCKELGASETLGIEGNWINESMLSSSFELYNTDLKKPIHLNKKYDLTISLEVAEHVPESNSDDFINSLSNSSDLILFSAAVIGQGGKGHVNEQNQSYWVEKFTRRGYSCMDVIRPKIWNDERIDTWYKQNIFIFSRKQEFTPCLMPIDVIHPDLFRIYSKPGIFLILKNLLRIPQLILDKITK